jgi:hypothetical protein
VVSSTVDKSSQLKQYWLNSREKSFGGEENSLRSLKEQESAHNSFAALPMLVNILLYLANFLSKRLKRILVVCVLGLQVCLCVSGLLKLCIYVIYLAVS